MKLRVTKRARLVADRDGTDAKPAGFEPSSDASQDDAREQLYCAIEQAQASLHRRVPADAAMASIRRWYPEPGYFIETARQTPRKTGISRMDAFYYSMIPNLTRTSLSQQWGTLPNLGKLSRMAAYLRTLYVGVHVECFYLVLLNSRGKLIRTVLLQRGTVNSAPFYLPQVLSEALAHEAKYIVLAHNHPGGTRRPSEEDMACTLRALRAVAPLHITLLDHIIVVPDGAVSVREIGSFPEVLWMRLYADDRMVQEWNDTDLMSMFEEPK